MKQAPKQNIPWEKMNVWKEMYISCQTVTITPNGEVLTSPIHLPDNRCGALDGGKCRRLGKK